MEGYTTRSNANEIKHKSVKVYDTYLFVSPCCWRGTNSVLNLIVV